MKSLRLARLRAELAQARWMWDMAEDALGDGVYDFVATWEFSDAWRRVYIKADNAIYDIEVVK